VGDIWVTYFSKLQMACTEFSSDNNFYIKSWNLILLFHFENRQDFLPHLCVCVYIYIGSCRISIMGWTWLSGTHCPVHIVRYTLSGTHYPVHTVWYTLSGIYLQRNGILPNPYCMLRSLRESMDRNHLGHYTALINRIDFGRYWEARTKMMENWPGFFFITILMTTPYY